MEAPGGRAGRAALCCTCVHSPVTSVFFLPVLSISLRWCLVPFLVFKAYGMMFGDRGTGKVTTGRQMDPATRPHSSPVWFLSAEQSRPCRNPPTVAGGVPSLCAARHGLNHSPVCFFRPQGHPLPLHPDHGKLLSCAPRAGSPTQAPCSLVLCAV